MAKLLGLTGGIGSGKSTAADIFRGLGVPVADADAVSRSLTAAGGRAVPAVRAHFGDDFVTPEGAMDRARMRAHVFGNAENRRALESLLAPFLEEGIREAVADALTCANARGMPYAVLDCPLLTERPRWRALCDEVLVIDLSEAEQIRRVCRRSNLTEDTVRSILKAQASRIERLNTADYVLYNGDTPEALEVRLQTLHTKFLRHFA